MSSLPEVAESYAAPAALAVWRRRALTVGVAAALLCAVGAFLDPGQFFRSYLVAFLLWLGVAGGCLFVTMLQYVTGGAWGIVIRRVVEAAARTMPFVFVLFLPLAVGVEELFVWARADVVAHDDVLQRKAWYLNTPFFLIRAVLYFAIWSAWAWLIDRAARRLDRGPDATVSRRLQIFCAVGLAVYTLTVSFAGIDWLMSLDPHWYSSIYGIYFLGGHMLSAFAFLIPVALLLSRTAPLKGVVAARHFHDWGKLLFAFVMLWAYFSYSQFLIIWSGNLPEEVSWYLARTHGAWRFVAIAIIMFHFALPFLMLLSRDLKKSSRALATVAVSLLAMRYIDMYWQAIPAFHEHGRPHWLDPVTLIAVGGLWLGVYAWQLGQRPLLPLNDPELAEASGDA